MAAISKIRIDGFKAFPKEFELVLNGKNLLMYGENGSGKSSIYYALHALLQSQYHDKGAIYFDKDSTESIVNKDTTTAEPYIEIELEGNDEIKYRLSKKGYEEIPHQPISPLRDMNAACVFINHKFLFRTFSFRNSEYIDLFPVFIKDILPFVLTRDNAEYIGNIYDDVMKGIQRHGKTNQLEDSYKKRIERFNLEVQHIINQINSIVSEIYNKNFRNENERSLKIVLEFDDNRDKVPLPNKSYWLRCGYRYQLVNKAGGWKPKQISSGYEILQPSIILKVEEEINSTYQSIGKPQTHFNEARLTAIALSIRFSLLDIIAAANGRFMALDDMLISLDMSNRAKVVDFLLSISDKYKIYLFTHDKAFYNYISHIINQKGKSSDWTFKRISYNYTEKRPMILDDSCEYLSKAKYFYDLGDYETSAIYFRKTLEQNIGERLPFELKTRVDGGFLELQTLWDKFIKFYAHNGTPIDREMQKIFSASKLLILNPAAHFQRLANPIYKSELDEIFKLINYICRLSKIEKQLILEQGKTLVFQHPKENYNCSFILDDDLVIIEGDHIVAKIPKCKNIKWEYNGVEYWNFELQKQDLENPLIAATPKLTNFIDKMIKKVPLNITQKMFVKNCKINGVSLLEFMGNIDLLRISVKI